MTQPIQDIRPGHRNFSSAIAGEVAAMRLAHKHHHHLLEHIIPGLVIGSEGFMVYHNYHLAQRYKMGY